MKKTMFCQVLAVLSLIFLAHSVYAQNQEVKKYKVVARLSISVDYSESIRSVIGRSKFDWVNPVVLEKQPIQTNRGIGREDDEIIIIEFEERPTSEEVITAMKIENLNPANIWHLGNLDQKNPDIPRALPIAFLGSEWYDSHSYRCVPVFFNGISDCDLLLVRSTSDAWQEDYRFAGVKK